MTPAQRPTLIVLAGPNGSGKSTLYETRIRPDLSVPFINADIIQRDELNDTDMNAAYRAAELASKRRNEFLAQRKSFVTETVFSHPSKLDLIHEAKKLGYRIMVFHICVEHPDLSVARVSERVKEGGHPVPEEKIRQRYDRNGPLIRQAALLSDIAHIYDNSKLNQPPERIMSFTAGKVSFSVTRLPDWVLKIYAEDIGD
ncbi:MAG: hypothetical protein COA69_09730 [Robiginitomaculum sp.]|nr:MAG: hypothetical protein COA69_09730 [Robiginitomaculum sp.]